MGVGEARTPIHMEDMNLGMKRKAMASMTATAIPTFCIVVTSVRSCWSTSNPNLPP